MIQYIVDLSRVAEESGPRSVLYLLDIKHKRDEDLDVSYIQGWVVNMRDWGRVRVDLNHGKENE